MRALVVLTCWFFGHATPPGVLRALSWRYCCARCNRVVQGELGSRRRT